MKYQVLVQGFKAWTSIAATGLLATTLACAMVQPNTKTFENGQAFKVKGIIVSHDGGILKLRADDDSIGTVDLTDSTKVMLKHGMFGMNKTSMDVASLLPGLRIEADGKGNDKGELVADRVVFDPGSMKASRQIDTRVSPLEARAGSLEGRAGQLEGRAGQLEGRAGQLEGRAGQLEDAQKQTQQQVGQVKATAEQATQGVDNVNKRVSDLDNYETKFSATIYFKLNSTVLTADGKKQLDDLAAQAQNEKGYMVEVAGFADKSGKLARNQTLSQLRAQAVVQYLEEQGNVPIRRILTPAGLGTSHEVADNRTPSGRKMNRRVEVNVLVNRGVVALSNPPANPVAAQPTQASNK